MKPAVHGRKFKDSKIIVSMEPPIAEQTCIALACVCMLSMNLLFLSTPV